MPYVIAHDTPIQEVSSQQFLGLGKGVARFLDRPDNHGLRDWAVDICLASEYDLVFSNALFLAMDPVAWLRESRHGIHVSYSPARKTHNLWDTICILGLWMWALPLEGSVPRTGFRVNVNPNNGHHFNLWMAFGDYLNEWAKENYDRA